MSDVTNPWVCLECGQRQAEAGACNRCHGSEVLDARKEQVRGLMADVDLRLGDRREARLRWGAVIIAIAVVGIAWTMPGYWHLRGRLYPGLPFLADQFAFMIGLGMLLLFVGKRTLGHKPRFPYLDEQQQIVDAT